MPPKSPQSQPDDAMVDLLIKQVTEGLSPAEQRALDVLDDEVASGYLRDFERAAAAIVLAGSARAEPMPAALRRRVDELARGYFTPATVMARADDTVIQLKPPRPPSAAETPPQSIPQSTAPPAPPRTASRSGAYGWFAAAACLVLAVFGWLRSPSPLPPSPAPTLGQSAAPPAAPPTTPPTTSVASNGNAPTTPIKPATPAEERAALLAAPAALKIKLAATKDPGGAGASGDVVWDPATQRGYLHFVGLAPNDPAVHQYQLWIFDGARDQRYPVDGGVFDIPANATDVVVPIHAALNVHKAAAFAITVERPGGVVVSGREHIVVLGAAG
jgi:hypothetical protein